MYTKTNRCYSISMYKETSSVQMNSFAKFTRNPILMGGKSILEQKEDGLTVVCYATIQIQQVNNPAYTSR